MPEAAEFLAGFGFVKGTRFAGYILVNAMASHESISRYQEYKYHLTLVFQKAGLSDYISLYNAVANNFSQEHIIYGIRNPYRCIIDHPVHGDITEDDDGTVTFKLTGHSYRVYKH